MRSIAADRARSPALWLLGALSGAALAAPLDAPSAAPADDAALEQILRERLPGVQRWETRPMETRNATPQTPIDAVGRIGARTSVRYADGRVRWFAVAGFAPALVAARAVDAGTTIDAAAVRVEERDIVGAGCEPLTSLDANVRWRAATRLSSGETLCARSIEAAPDVERSRNVVLSAQRGGVEVSRLLVAADDARTGDRVRLTDSSSGDVFVAVVTGAGTARAPRPGENP